MQKKGERLKSAGFQRRARKRRMRKWRGTFLFLLFCIMIVGMFYYFWTRPNGYEVFLNEKSLGQLKEEHVTSKELMNTVKAQLESSLGTSIELNEEAVLKPVHIDKKKLVTTDYLIATIREQITYQVSASSIVVNGDIAVILANQTEAEEVLNKILSEAEGKLPEEMRGTLTISDFEQNVEIQEEFVDKNEISTADKAYDILTKKSNYSEVYTVKSGDTFSGIADYAEMTRADIIALNPGFDPDKSLVIGQTINLNVKRPYLTVKKK